MQRGYDQTDFDRNFMDFGGSDCLSPRNVMVPELNFGGSEKKDCGCGCGGNCGDEKTLDYSGCGCGGSSNYSGCGCGSESSQYSGFNAEGASEGDPVPVVSEKIGDKLLNPVVSNKNMKGVLIVVGLIGAYLIYKKYKK